MASSFGQDFLKGFFGNDYLKDYRHAAKTFLSNGSEFLPRQKFLFHVYFNLNTPQVPQLSNVFGTLDKQVVGLMVKSIQLPSFQLDVETMNQYNRKRLVQTRINYQPVQVTFNDDGGDLVRKLWYNYYTYYYKDPSYAYDGVPTQDGTNGINANQPAGFDYNSRSTYAPDRLVNDWGYIGESYNDGTTNTDGKPAFFRDIRIFGFNQHKYAEYVLINPMIEQWAHDTYDYASSEGMVNTCSIRYETVKYRSGLINGATGAPVPGFAQPEYYDKQPSALSRPGATASILGPGGLLEGGLGIVNDLEKNTVGGYVGAVQKAGTIFQTFKGKNLRAVVNEEANTNLRKILRNGIGTGSVRQAANTRGGFSFPIPPVSAPNNTSAVGTPPFNPGPNITD